MNISDIRERSKRFVATFRHEGFSGVANRIPRDVVIVTIILLTAGTFFGAGVFYAKQSVWGSVIIETLPFATSTADGTSAKNSHRKSGEVVASKNGSKYYLPWCAGAKRLSLKTKIRFASESIAKKHGYTPAINCKGI